MKHIRVLSALLTVLVCVVTISVEIAQLVYVHEAAASELPSAVAAEAVDGEEHPQPDTDADLSATHSAIPPVLVDEPHTLISDGRPFRPPLQYLLKV